MSPAARGGAVRVLFATPELHPLVKTGGLGDVAGALPPALRALGVDTRLLVPGYPGVLDGLRLRRVARGLRLLPHVAEADLLRGRMPDGDTPVYVLDCAALYRRGGGPYHDEAGVEWPDNAERFALLARAAAVLGTAASPLRWRPDVVHGNDWQCGLAPAYLAAAREPRARTVQSIHNIAFAGAFSPALAGALGLAPEAFRIDGYEFHGRLSYLKAGVYYADMLATVSPTYAEEIQTPAYGGGFHGLLAARRAHLAGIVNGIDQDTWNPRTDPHIERRYGERSLAGKAVNKAALQALAGLDVVADVPLLGIVSRLTAQKGIDLVPGALERLAGRDFQLIALGSGDARIEAALARLADVRPARVRFTRAFDEGLAHRIEAGADVFLMPSRFEPCGLNQMYSMRYGTLPVVRMTGGLADTVVHADPRTMRTGTATGFVFRDADVTGLAWAIEQALDLYPDRRAWRAIQRRGMTTDFSWTRSAGAYRALYAGLLPRARSR